MLNHSHILTDFFIAPGPVITVCTIAIPKLVLQDTLAVVFAHNLFFRACVHIQFAFFSSLGTIGDRAVTYCNPFFVGVCAPAVVAPGPAHTGAVQTTHKPHKCKRKQPHYLPINCFFITLFTMVFNTYNHGVMLYIIINIELLSWLS